MEPRDVLLESLDLVEPLVRLGKGGSGDRLNPNENAETARLRSQREHLLVFREKHVGLHEELLPIGDHRREKLLRERLVGRQVVVQKRDEPIPRPLNVGDDVFDGPGPESQAADVTGGAERTGMGAAPRRLDWIEWKIPGGIEQIQPGRFQPGQVDRSVSLVEPPHPSSRGIGYYPRPHFVSLTHHHRVSVL
mgnify:CR=1 FL=1